METASVPRKKSAHKTTTRMLPRWARDPETESRLNISLPVPVSLLVIANIAAGRDKNRPRQRNFLAAFIKGQLDLDPAGNSSLIRPRLLPAGFDLFFSILDFFAIEIILELDRLDRSHLSRTNTPFSGRGNCRGKIFFLFYQRLLRAVKIIRSFFTHGKRVAILIKLRADSREAHAPAAALKFDRGESEGAARVTLKIFQEQ